MRKFTKGKVETAPRRVMLVVCSGCNGSYSVPLCEPLRESVTVMCPNCGHSALTSVPNLYLYDNRKSLPGLIYSDRNPRKVEPEFRLLDGATAEVVIPVISPEDERVSKQPIDYMGRKLGDVVVISGTPLRGEHLRRGGHPGTCVPSAILDIVHSAAAWMPDGTDGYTQPIIGYGVTGFIPSDSEDGHVVPAIPMEALYPPGKEVYDIFVENTEPDYPEDEPVEVDFDDPNDV